MLALAARVWRRAELAGAAAGALLKLRAAGVEAEETGQPGIEPRLTGEAAFGPLWEAVRDRRPVTFAYRAVGRSEPQQRKLEPWGVVNRHGRWYVAGHDQVRDAVRVFRLSRIEGAGRVQRTAGRVSVPDGHRRAGTGGRMGRQARRAARTATLKMRSGTGYGLRRWASRERAGRRRMGPGGRAILGSVGWFAEHIASFGADVMRDRARGPARRGDHAG